MKSIDDCIVGFENIKYTSQISFQELNFFFSLNKKKTKKHFYKCYIITIDINNLLIKQNSKS
ncbi:MAG: hypothetical protein CMP38_04395 [Rickettsiales bacterium]|nr:hypothetical protein [Rickettsiales bacterium]